MDKLRVTFIHKVSNPRDQNGNIPHAVMPLDADKLILIAHKGDTKALGKYLRDANVLCYGVRIREWRLVTGTSDMLHVFPQSTHHCVSICLTPTNEPLTSDKFLALQQHARVGGQIIA